MKDIKQIEQIISQEKENLREEFKVKSIGVFGSYARGEQQIKSDLDLLVEFEKPISMFRFIELEDYLSELLKIRVDLVTQKALKPVMGKNILKEVVMI